MSFPASRSCPALNSATAMPARGRSRSTGSPRAASSARTPPVMRPRTTSLTPHPCARATRLASGRSRQRVESRRWGPTGALSELGTALLDRRGPGLRRGPRQRRAATSAGGRGAAPTRSCCRRCRAPVQAARVGAPHDEPRGAGTGGRHRRLEQRAGHAHRGQAVGERMVEDDEHADPAVPEPGHEPESATAAGTDPEVGHQPLREREQRRLVARRRDGDLADMVVDRERRVVDPERPAGQRTRPENDATQLGKAGEPASISRRISPRRSRPSGSRSTRPSTSARIPTWIGLPGSRP